MEFSNISLIGFMGTGKSTIGKLLAEQLYFNFIETDDYITQKIKQPLPLFVKEHEEDFRNLEKKFCSNLNSFTKTIISCGGGIILNNENISNLRQFTLVILLEANVNTILERVLKDGIANRPILQKNDLKKSILNLLNKRSILYQKASHITINTDNKNLSDILTEIKLKLKK